MRLLLTTIILTMLAHQVWADKLAPALAEQVLVEGEIINKAFIKEREAFLYSVTWKDRLFYCYHEMVPFGSGTVECHSID